MEQTTIINIVVAWLLSVGATFFFTYVCFVSPLKNNLHKLRKETEKLQDETQTSKRSASDFHTNVVNRLNMIESTNVKLTKTVDGHKTETTKVFETVTEAFELLNTERVIMIKDLSEMKRRVRMNNNETKRQTHQQRHR